MAGKGGAGSSHRRPGINVTVKGGRDLSDKSLNRSFEITRRGRKRVCDYDENLCLAIGR